MDISSLKYPRKSHRKVIRIPQESLELAELMGIEFGDGGINNNWQVVISVNSVADKEYAKYVANLFKRLFATDTKTRVRQSCNTIVIVATSTNLVDFLIEKGAIKGNKITKQINIPDWIKNNRQYERYFVRGLVDTDGCLFTHKHYIKGKLYFNIGFCFSSYSNKLLNSVYLILTKNGLKAHIRKEKHSIYLYSKQEVIKYLGIFGSSNPRIYKKFEKWKGARVV